MPEQKCLTIDGTQVYYKIYRKKQGTFDIVKLCIGACKPEKQWSSHHLAHDIVNSCATTQQLAQAVRVLAGDVMGVAVTPKSGLGCQHCKQPAPQQPSSSANDAAPPASVPVPTPGDASASTGTDPPEPTPVAEASQALLEGARVEMPARMLKALEAREKAAREDLTPMHAAPSISIT